MKPETPQSKAKPAKRKKARAAATSWPPFSPKTEEEKAEAFRLLDELQNEFAKDAAFREKLAEMLGEPKPEA